MLSPNPTNIGTYMSNYTSARSIEPDEELLSPEAKLVGVAFAIGLVILGGIVMSYGLLIAGVLLLSAAVAILVGGLVYIRTTSITRVVITLSLMALLVVAVVMGTPEAFLFMLALAATVGIAYLVVLLANRRQSAYDAYRGR